MEKEKEYSDAYPKGGFSHMWSGPVPVVRLYPKRKRNSPCICGSGEKYKKCCARIGQ
ncbi:MAG: SEC-C metal-binding domain-containing protein [Sulfuricurvum sp.]|uniref:SEC-C metal-binding domain-containing protein n=1 Tax=Sulfuricurvum sp. TaxID=2025608 RepID=UPI0027335BCF|nr:SEC-C metal-binding domain-containing protein [Sulfuricurvum sp.]MDP3290634.1 SEC-C metal-binding domain-containing protein [Sulfuricurvum sp.]